MTDKTNLNTNLEAEEASPTASESSTKTISYGSMEALRAAFLSRVKSGSVSLDDLGKKVVLLAQAKGDKELGELDQTKPHPENPESKETPTDKTTTDKTAPTTSITSDSSSHTDSESK